MATDMNLQFEYKMTDLKGLVDGLASGEYDIGVAPLTMTAEREEKIDYTYSYFNTGLSIAVPNRGSGSWTAAAGRLLSMRFLQVVVALIAVLLAVGFLVWLFERKRNPDMFGGSAAHGIGSGFWWSAVTMTTVGYGDKAPLTLGGRLIGLIWMFVALIIISSFTAAITSALTVSQLSSGITGPDDLYRARVATVENSASATYLTDHSISFRAVDSPADGLALLAAGEVDAVVYDAPILRFLINQSYKSSLRILPGLFVEQNYAFGLSTGNPLTEQLNRALLQVTASQEWQRVLAEYLGD
jgi:ABC-type amino acid transport substrate-binding protein